jgi:hypothetical protein
LADPILYTISITSLGSNSKRSLMILNQYFSHGISRTRDAFAEGGGVLLEAPANTVIDIAAKLSSEGLRFRITPEFPYDYSICDPRRSHEHEWRSIGNEKGA